MHGMGFLSWLKEQGLKEMEQIIGKITKTLFSHKNKFSCS
jgi:hypothetical protein